MTRMISFWVLVAIIVVVGLLFYQVMSGFLLPLFLAAMLVVIFQPIYRWVLARCRGRAMVASGLTTLLVVSAVFVPMGWAITLAASQSISMARQLDMNRATRQIQKLRVALNLDLPLAEDIVDLAPLIEALAEATPTSGPAVQVPPDETRSAPKPAELSPPPDAKPSPDVPSASQPSASQPSASEPSADDRQPAGDTAAPAKLPLVDPSTDAPAAATPTPIPATPSSATPSSATASSATASSATPSSATPPANPTPEKAETSKPSTEPSDAPASASEKLADEADSPDQVTPTGLTDPTAARGTEASGAEVAGADLTGDFTGLVEPESPRAQELLDVIVERVKEIERQIPIGEASRQRPEVAGAIERVKALRESLSAARTSLNANDADGFARDVAVVRQSFQSLVSFLPGNAVRVWLKNLMNPSPAKLQEYRDRVFIEIQNWLLPAANVTVAVALKLIFGTIIMIVSVFFFFADGERMTATITRLIPLDVRHQRELLEDFGEICRAVVLATLTSAAVQSVLAGLGFWMAGVESVALLMVLTMVFAMIPFVGAFTVWLPVCLWIGFVEERFWTAVLLAIYCGIVVSQSDNIVKPMILQGRSNLHPLLALLSILGGVKALGPIGILVGPMVVVFLQTLLNILHREIVSMEQSKNAAVKQS